MVMATIDDRYAPLRDAQSKPTEDEPARPDQPYGRTSGWPDSADFVSQNTAASALARARNAERDATIADAYAQPLPSVEAENAAVASLPPISYVDLKVEHGDGLLPNTTPEQIERFERLIETHSDSREADIADIAPTDDREKDSHSALTSSSTDEPREHSPKSKDDVAADLIGDRAEGIREITDAQQERFNRLIEGMAVGAGKELTQRHGAGHGRGGRSHGSGE